MSLGMLVMQDHWSFKAKFQMQLLYRFYASMSGNEHNVYTHGLCVSVDTIGKAFLFHKNCFKEI